MGRRITCDEDCDVGISVERSRITICHVDFQSREDNPNNSERREYGNGQI